MSDFDAPDTSAAVALEPRVAPATTSEAAEAAAELDAKLDRTVREVADVAFAKRDEPPKPNGKSMRETIAAVYDEIAARPEPMAMPRLPEGATLGDTLKAADEWKRTDQSTRRSITNAHVELASLKQAADGFGLKMESVADVKALKDMMGAQQAAAPAAPNPVWQSLGLGPEQCKTDGEAIEQLSGAVRFVEQHGAMGMREVVQRLGWNPLELLTQADIEQLRGQSMPDMEAARYQYAVDDFAARKGEALTPAIRQCMATEVLPQMPDDGGVPSSVLLDTAFREAKRLLSQRAKRGLNEKMHETLGATWDDIHGKRGRR